MPDGSSAMLSFSEPVDHRESVASVLLVLKSAYPYLDTLNESPIVKTAAMYANLAIDEGIAALGQSLSHFGCALYSVATGADNFVFFLRPADEKPVNRVPVIWDGQLTHADLCLQAKRSWGEKARQIRSPKLELVADFWDDGNSGEIEWLSTDLCLWRDPGSTLVADISRWDDAPEGIEHMLRARLPGESADAQYSLSYTALPVETPDGDALWAVSRYAAPVRPRKGTQEAAYSLLFYRQAEALGEYSLPVAFPPELPETGGGSSAAASGTVAAEYRPTMLKRLADGWRLDCAVCDRKTYGKHLAENIAIFLDAQLQPMAWARRTSGGEAVGSAPQPLGIGLAGIPGLPGAAKGWEITGTEMRQDETMVFALRALDIASGREYLRPLRGMQPRLGEYRYGQQIVPLLLPEDWLLLDIRGDDFGLEDSAWLWHLPDDRMLAIPLGAVSPHRENVDFHYNPALDCLFAVNCSYDRSTVLFRLCPRTEMLSRLNDSASLQRRPEDWIAAP